MIKLVNDTIDQSDIDHLIEWLQQYPKLTKGPVTLELEALWSQWIGVKHSIFCNSGSSANLLMLWALVESNRIPKHATIVVPSVAWATDLAPVIQLGMKPLLCDINLNDLSVCLEHLETLFQSEKPDALLLVSVLGLVPDMSAIVALCERYNVILLEDTCESMGSQFNQKKLGSFGLMSSFSTYFGHHISTIEGGFVSTNDSELYEILKAIRSHGWDRDASPDTQTELRKKWEISEFDALYTFYYSGFNLRSTDLQATIGIRQIQKLDAICQKRNQNFLLYDQHFSNMQPIIPKRGFISNFAYPIIHKEKTRIVQALQNQNIEVRPMICGSMGSQPFYVKHYDKQALKNASLVDQYGFYVPNHPGLTHHDIEKVTDIIENIAKE